jgi:ATP-dependent DNA helicase RecG
MIYHGLIKMQDAVSSPPLQTGRTEMDMPVMTVAEKYQRFDRPEKLFVLFARISALPGIGDKLYAILKKKIGDHVIDLLRHLPVDVIDRSERPAIANIRDGAIVTLEVTVIKHDRPPRGVRRPMKVFAENETGQIEIVFFHAKGNYVEKQLPIGAKRIISGRAEWYNKKVQIAHPDHIIDPAKLAEIPVHEAVYPLTAGLTPRVLAKAMRNALERLPVLDEWIPGDLITRFQWPDWQSAMQDVHHPVKAYDLMPGSPARARLAYDELLANQLALAMVRRESTREQGRAYGGDGKLRKQLIEALPFSLTGAQDRVIREILTDQHKPDRMLRLLQGDVGAGKTLVALVAMLNVVETGAQATLLAPTEILARQHHATLAELLAPLGIAPYLLISKMKTAERREVEENIAGGDAKIIIGTHALLSDQVSYHDLGLAVVDEQHRFGVRQRIILGEKGDDVDVLVMTATPIPRTLALTAYGDLNSSRLDEKPAGRKPVITTSVPVERVDDVIDRLKTALAEGKRAYWICPLVDESDALDIQAAEERHVILTHALPDANARLVHGKMDAETRDTAMEKFRIGESKLLVATTVVEVGVDVPEASIMIIEHAERFGLAQMHQLRGRVGRSDEKSSCLLMFKPPLNEVAEARLNIMKQSNDGFKIAEEDLRLRGPGEVLGRRQSGDPEFTLADLAYHDDLLMLAREQAEDILKRNPALEGEDGGRLKTLLALFERDKAVTYLAGG